MSSTAQPIQCPICKRTGFVHRHGNERVGGAWQVSDGFYLRIATPHRMGRPEIVCERCGTIVSC